MRKQMASTRPHAHLRTRILIWSFVPTTLILFAVAVTIYFAYQHVTEDLVVGRNQQLIRLSAGELAANLNTYVNTLNALTRTPDMYTGDTGRQSLALNQDSNQLLIFDGGILILDRYGKVAAVVPNQPNLISQDWSDRSFFRQVIRNSEPAFSDILPNVSANSTTIGVAVPILNPRGEFRGMLVGLFNLGANSSSAFYGGIVKLRLGETGSTYLVDNTGRVIYHPDESLIGMDVHSQPDVQPVLRGEVGFLRTRDSNNRDILATYAPVPGTSWGLIHEEEWSSLLAASQGYGQFLYLLLVLGIIFPAIVVFFGVKHITDPIAKFTTAAKEIAGGNYGQQIEVNTGDELEELGNQFNQMSVQLSESYSQLERRVAARTRELATLNAIAAVVSRSLDLEEIMNDALNKILEVLEMELGSAYAIDDEGKGLKLLAEHGLSAEFIDRLSPRPLKGSVVEKAALLGYPLVWLLDDYPEIEMKPLLAKQGIAQIICVPLMVKGRLVGAFNFGAHESRPISKEELSLLGACGQQIGVAVENARLYRQAEETAAISERTRLARELHDSVTQTLFSASLIAEVLPDLWEMNQKEGWRRLEELRQLTRGALAEMRTLLVELRPNALVEIPLPDLLRQLCEALIGRTRLPIQLSIAGQQKLPADVQVGLYRITQEALNNIVKHSKATQAVVTLRLNGSLHLSIADNGCGFEIAKVPPDHLGLKIMGERAKAIGAKLSIYSEPGDGTQISVTWIDNNEEEKEHA
jgi:nitrate/nitrite-specific signal transduction histidine kinase